MELHILSSFFSRSLPNPHTRSKRTQLQYAMAAHLWLAPLDDETISVFAFAFTISRDKSFRVSTERVIAALPSKLKDQMRRLCEAAQSECKIMDLGSQEDFEDPPDDWQEKIYFSTCIESALHKCLPGTNLVTFLRILCRTASRLHCIVDRNMPVEEYLTDGALTLNLPALVTAPFPPPSMPPPLHQVMMAPPHPERWQYHGASTASIGDILHSDVLLVLMSSSNSIEMLRKCKAVSKSWRAAARETLSDVDWLCENKFTIHHLLKKGEPSPQLVLRVVAREPKWMYERDREGLLPLQYAAAYRMDAALVAALRKATSVHVGWGASFVGEANCMKNQLRPVLTRIAHAPVM